MMFIIFLNFSYLIHLSTLCVRQFLYKYNIEKLYLILSRKLLNTVLKTVEANRYLDKYTQWHITLIPFTP